MTAACEFPRPGVTFRHQWYGCEGQRHAEGGKAHSAATPHGLVIWWQYGNGRTRVLLRDAP